MSNKTDASAKAAATRILMKMYKGYQEDPSPYFNCGLIDNNPFHWRLIINGVEGTILSGGLFPAELTFKDDFPLSPPKMVFKCPMWHPNIDSKTGDVCISILHNPGVDELNPQESASERWNPTHTVESIVLSVLSMLQSPNPESPLNIPANREFMNDPEKYKQNVRRHVRRSIEYL
ncbi:ubiquitin-conjugating enzyme E2 G1 [Tritrichomonas musculus]|uniref:Ubiquitin-conjugating enzyme E2 G1 n=1 Tax=Tritrichomonas musculus TaxID=1915356 RepID=A0ABR2K1T8_9EUKA